MKIIKIIRLGFRMDYWGRRLLWEDWGIHNHSIQTNRFFLGIVRLSIYRVVWTHVLRNWEKSTILTLNRSYHQNKNENTDDVKLVPHFIPVLSLRLTYLRLPKLATTNAPCSKLHGVLVRGPPRLRLCRVMCQIGFKKLIKG